MKLQIHSQTNTVKQYNHETTNNIKFYPDNNHTKCNKTTNETMRKMAAPSSGHPLEDCAV